MRRPLASPEKEVLTPDGWTGAYWRNKSMTLNKLLIYLSGRRTGEKKGGGGAAPPAGQDEIGECGRQGRQRRGNAVEIRLHTGVGHGSTLCSISTGTDTLLSGPLWPRFGSPKKYSTQVVSLSDACMSRKRRLFSRSRSNNSFRARSRIEMCHLAIFVRHDDCGARRRQKRDGDGGRDLVRSEPVDRRPAFACKDAAVRRVDVHINKCGPVWPLE